MHVFIGHTSVVSKVAILWQRVEIDRKNEHADSSLSVSSRISTSKQSVIQLQNLVKLQATKAVGCGISTNKVAIKLPLDTLQYADCKFYTKSWQKDYI